MKKLYLLFLMLLILFIPKTFAVTPYLLDQQVPELNGFTLREVFENRNMTMPDLTGKDSIAPNVFRLYNNNGITIDYNTNNGSWYINGTSTANIFHDLFNIDTNTTYTLTHNKISGSVSNTFALYMPTIFTLTINPADNDLTTTFNSDTRNIVRINISSGRIFDNYTFKLQLEKGSTATPYQVPTNGPYSDIDVGEFNLTPEQIDMYYDYYLEAVEFENRGGISMEFFLISIFFMYILIMIVGYFTKSKYFYFAGSLLWLVPIFNYQNIFIITTSIIVFLIHLTFIFYSDKDDVFE